MERVDALIIGPLEPLLPRPVRVRLTLVVAVAVAVVCMGVAAALIVALEVNLLPGALENALAAKLPGWLTASDDTAPRAASVQVTTSPAGARILLGNRELGSTPTLVSANPDELLILRHDGFLDAFVRADSPNLDVPLWRAQPEVRLLRPPVPGAAIRSAEFLPDGRVTLTIEVPPTGERQPWAYDPTSARLDRLGTTTATPGTLPSTVAVASDGTHTATILHLDGLDGAAADQLTLDGLDGPHQPLGTGAHGERLLDVTWSPNADGVLLLSQRQARGGTRFVQRWVGTDGGVRELADLPKQPVVGSWVWAPDGHTVAFLVQSNPTALVTLDTTSGELRNLDDLRADAVPSSGAVAPATWEASGALLYAAAASTGSRSPASSTPTAPVLFEVAPGRVDAHRLGDVEPVWAPIVRADGMLLTLARADNDVLVLRPVDPAGHARAEQRLGVQVSGAFSARWDLGHQQLLIVRGASGGGVEVLLLRFGTEVGQ